MMKPTLVTDSLHEAEAILREDYGRSIREFQVVCTSYGLHGVRGDVFSLITYRDGREAKWLREHFDQQVKAGLIIDHGRDW